MRHRNEQKNKKKKKKKGEKKKLLFISYTPDILIQRVREREKKRKSGREIVWTANENIFWSLNDMQWNAIVRLTLTRTAAGSGTWTDCA